jgi:two-component system, OmpR family, phosphate regulon sensor histidine kinase PhoR
MITVALAGLMAVQLALLSIAWDLKDQAFRRNVITALGMTVQNLEAGEITGDALNFIYHTGTIDTLHPRLRHIETIAQDRRLLNTREVRPDTTTIKFETHLPQGESWTNLWADNSSGSGQMTVIVGGERTEYIQRIVGDLVLQEPRLIRERLDRAAVDSLLRINLEQVGIDLTPEFGVNASGADTLVLASADKFLGEGGDRLRQSALRSRLFPLDMTGEIYEISLFFPGQRRFLLQQVGPLLAASILFIAVIIAAFVLTLGTVGRQRRFAVRMVDFINNMTHEFKTPISTVSLASEAIGRAGIVDQPEALQRYNRMIRDENLRMRSQVEKILQIAQLEAGDFQLNHSSVDVHELATGTADAFALRIEHRGGTLDLELGAGQSLVRGDPVHLSNVLSNLVDNAIKYSPEAPVISVTTSNRGGFLFLEVRDRGIGIQRSDHQRVFEKYYRCPTGDRHDVKGFGIGLSFVRLLAEAHGGTVALDSVPGQGTRVVLSLPLDEGEPRPGSRK